MRQKPKKTLAVKKETIRQLELRPLSNDELAQIAGGYWTYQPRKSISCCC